MTYTFELGADVRVDLNALVDTRLLVQANSGGGKSWCLRRLLEQTHGRVQQLVIDPEGEFATLRERFDYVLAAKRNGDTVADPRSAALLAERLLELGVSAVLDIYELKAPERIRFVQIFLEAMVEVRKELWHPVLVVLDEAHVYCPEKGKGRSDVSSAGAVTDMATRGRKRGFCLVLATQRLSKLNKDAAAECNNKLIGRAAMDVDMKRSADELGFTGRDEMHQLRGMDPGEFFAFGPALTPTVRRIRVGTVQTSHPKAGARLAFTPPPPTAKVRALLPKLADLPAEAAERQRTVEELRRDLAHARRELTIAQKAQPVAPAPKVERVEVPVLKDAQLARLEKLVERVAGAGEQLTTFGRELAQSLHRTGNGRTTIPVSRPSPTSPLATASRSHVPKSDRIIPRTIPPDSSGDLSGPHQRILDALAWLDTVGIAQPSKVAVAFIAGYRPGGGAFQNPLGKLRGLGLIDYGAGTVYLTDAGRGHAQFPDTPPSVEALHRLVLDRLDGPERRILEPLLACYPVGLSKEQLAEASGYSQGGGAFQNPLGRLRSLQLVSKRGPIAALPVLFLEGAMP